MEETALIGRVSRLEKENNFSSVSLFKIPLYRLIRYKTREVYINTQVSFKKRTKTFQPIGKRKIKFFSGFRKYIGLNDLTVIFPFNRLSVVNGDYFDKFTDPVLELTELKGSNFVIVDPQSFISGYSRFHSTHVISNESRTVLLLVFKVVSKVLVPLIYGHKINPFLRMVKETLYMPDNYISTCKERISTFYAFYCYYLFWFKLVNPRRVLFVFREGNLPVLAACKRLSIPVAEFQHGVTLDNTMAYTGEYDERIDPDYFLSFGDYWKPEVFGMEPSRMIHIGWAFKQFVQNNEKKGKEYVLVISSTAISTEVLNALKVISAINREVFFDIRLHPAESYNEEQRNLLSQIPNATIVDNKQESFSVLSSYHYVIGEVSSVLFEALSVGCMVGMLNLCGLRPPIDKPGIRENFFVINDAKDFEQFLNKETDSSESKAEFYSDFDSKRFMEFIENKM